MLSCIVAMDSLNVIGLPDGTIPWKCKSDRDFFKDLVKNKNKIVGRKTWDSIKEYKWAQTKIIALSHGNGFVPDFNYGNTTEGTLFYSLDANEYLESCSSDSGEFVVIGGAEIYRLAAPYVSTLYVTRLDYSTCNAAKAIVFPWIEYNKFRWNTTVFKELEEKVTVYKMDRI